MTVYFIKAELPECDMVKVGFTNGNPLSRLKALQTGSPIDLQLLHSTSGSAADERGVHNLFRHAHSHGEWFYFTEGLWNLVGLLMMGHSIREFFTPEGRRMLLPS